MQPSPQAQTTSQTKLHALRFILAIGLLNAAGQSVITPLSAYIGERYGVDGFTIGIMATVYALAQFVSVPAIGILSDYYGRRPLMLICLLGSAISFVIFGIGGALWVLFLSRIIDGITGGNLGVMYAYIADLTEGEERTRYYGLLGAMAGVAIMLTPLTAGVLSQVSYEVPLYFMAVVTFASVVWGYFAMPESLNPEKRITSIPVKNLSPFNGVGYVLSLSVIRPIIVANFLRLFTVLVLHSNMTYFLKDHLSFTPLKVAYVFLVFGVTGIFAQAVLVGRLTKIFGEKKLAMVGLLIDSVGFAIVIFLEITSAEWLAYLSAFIVALGNGLALPTLLGLLTHPIKPDEQGRVQGGNQSLLAVARIFGPLWAGWAYESMGKSTPYLSSSMLLLVALGILGFSLSRSRAASAAVQAAVD